MPSNLAQEKTKEIKDRLWALCQLSDATRGDVDRLTKMVAEAPDPETAVNEILQPMALTSPALSGKWRRLLIELWLFHHPDDIGSMPELPLMAADVADAPFLNDAKRLLARLEDEPVTLQREHDEWLLDAKDVLDIARELPSLQDTDHHPVESEWGNLTVRRLRAVLHATRLVQPRKGKLVPVASRLKTFRRLTSAEQFYVCWHADAYHVDWARFAGLWSTYMQGIQGYLPVLWEMIDRPEAGRVEDRALWAADVLDTFSPLWDEEGLLNMHPGRTLALNIVQHHALPHIIDQFILRDLLERHGLVTLSEEFGMLSKFTWTSVGAKLLKAEAAGELSCGLDLLDIGGR